MGQVRLKSLMLSGFRSFVDDTYIEFPETGLVLLTGGSGWGKSSIPLGIAYALGFCPFPATELLTWGGVATLKVELTLQTPEGIVKVRRTPNLQLWVDGEQIRGGAKIVEDRLRSILGLDSEMMSLLTYRGQRKPGLFLSRTDAEKKELLMALLSLHRFEAAIDEGLAKIRDIDKRLTAAQADRDTLAKTIATVAPGEPIETIEATLSKATTERDELAGLLKQLQSQIKTLGDKQAAAGRDAAAVFDEGLAAAKKAFFAVRAPEVSASDVLVKLQTLIGQIKDRIRRAEAEDVDRRAEINKARADLEGEITETRGEVARKSWYEIEIKRLALQLAKIRVQSICPTCERPWAEAKAKEAELAEAHSKVMGQYNAVAGFEQTLENLLVKAKDLPEWTPSPTLGKLREALANQHAQVAAEEARLRGLAAEQKALHEAERATLKDRISMLERDQLHAKVAAEAEILDQITPLRALATNAEAPLRKVEGDITNLRVTLERVRTQLEQKAYLEQRLAEAEERLGAVSRELAAEKDFMLLIGREGFLGTIFDEVLAEISDETNKVLGTVANTRHCTIAFKSETLTEKGAVKKKIVPIVSVGGHEAPIASALSGGMLSTVELGTDLAVGAVVSRRAGVCPGWLILDESFEGLDPISKESCMEILTRYAQDRLVLVIDHATEFRALFTKEIAVKFENGRSSIA